MIGRMSGCVDGLQVPAIALENIAPLENISMFDLYVRGKARIITGVQFYVQVAILLGARILGLGREAVYFAARFLGQGFGHWRMVAMVMGEQDMGQSFAVQSFVQSFCVGFGDGAGVNNGDLVGSDHINAGAGIGERAGIVGGETGDQPALALRPAVFENMFIYERNINHG